MRVGLAAEAADAASRIVKTTLEPMLSEPANAFNNDVRFRAAFDEALETKRVVEALQTNQVDASSMKLADGGENVAVVTNWMRSSPPSLTRLKINGPEVCGAVLAALQQLVAETTTLVDVDVMECQPSRDGHTFTLNVPQLKGTTPIEKIDLSGKRLGVASAIVIASCIKGNASLKQLRCAT